VILVLKADISFQTISAILSFLAAKDSLERCVLSLMVNSHENVKSLDMKIKL
jgi:hypothetical protein